MSCTYVTDLFISLIMASRQYGSNQQCMACEGLKEQHRFARSTHAIWEAKKDRSYRDFMLAEQAYTAASQILDASKLQLDTAKRELRTHACNKARSEQTGHAQHSADAFEVYKAAEIDTLSGYVDLNERTLEAAERAKDQALGVKDTHCGCSICGGSLTVNCRDCGKDVTLCL